METSIKFFYFFLLINIALATPKIIGGRPANITEVPYQLELDWNSHHRCGAAIVGSQFAITAAHCFDDVTNNSVILRAGSASLEQGDIYSIQQYLINHDYVTWPNGIPDNDIAFIVVDRPFKLSDSVQIVKIAEVEPYDSEVGIVSGWGVTEDGGTIHSDILLSVEIPIVNRDACYDLYRRNITASMICAGKEGSGVCGGDSGGPLVVNGTLVGIVSWGFHCAVNYPGVFTNVAYFKNWIDEQINL